MFYVRVLLRLSRQNHTRILLAVPLISTAAVGHEFGPYDVSIPTERANAYAKAVGGAESPDYGDSLVGCAAVIAPLQKV